MPRPLRASRAPWPLAFLFAATSSLAQPCAQGEDTVWSCETKSRAYALCASPDVGPGTGYLQYRVRKGSDVEFVYPATHHPPQGLFEYHLYNRHAAVSFGNGGYEYAIQEGLDGQAYIDVTREGRPLKGVRCARSSDTLTLTVTIERFRAMGLYE